MRVAGILKLGASAACVIAALLVVAWLSPTKVAGPCTVEQRAMLPEMPEASGLAVSRRHPGLLWTHNDSGNAAELFALDESGAARGRVRVPMQMRDWEDVSAAACNGGHCLYLADIGDNSLNRRTFRYSGSRNRSRTRHRPCARTSSR